MKTKKKGTKQMKKLMIILAGVAAKMSVKERCAFRKAKAQAKQEG